MSVVELLVYVWAACKYLVFTVQGPGTPVSVSFCCPGFSFLFFMNASLCLLFLNFFHIWSYCARFFLFLFFSSCLLRNFVFLCMHGFVDTIDMCVFLSMYIQWDLQFCCIDKHLCTYMCMCSGGFRLIFCCFLIYSVLHLFFLVFALLFIVATALQCLSTYAFKKRHCHWVLCARLLYMYPHVLVV